MYVDLDRELAVQKACVEAAEAGLLLSAHDCADGGLAVALAESCFSSLGRDAIGAQLNLANLEGDLDTAAVLFSESPSRIVISFDPADEVAVRETAERHNAPFAILGRVSGTRLQITANGNEAVAANVADLEGAWRAALSDKLQAEVVAG